MILRSNNASDYDLRNSGGHLLINRFLFYLTLGKGSYCLQFQLKYSYIWHMHIHVIFTRDEVFSTSVSLLIIYSLNINELKAQIIWKYVAYVCMWLCECKWVCMGVTWDSVRYLYFFQTVLILIWRTIFQVFQLYSKQTEILDITLVNLIDNVIILFPFQIAQGISTCNSKSRGEKKPFFYAYRDMHITCMSFRAL